MVTNNTYKLNQKRAQNYVLLKRIITIYGVSCPQFLKFHYPFLSLKCDRATLTVGFVMKYKKIHLKKLVPFFVAFCVTDQIYVFFLNNLKCFTQKWTKNIYPQLLIVKNINYPNQSYGCLETGKLPPGSLKFDQMLL